MCACASCLAVASQYVLSTTLPVAMHKRAHAVCQAQAHFPSLQVRCNMHAALIKASTSIALTDWWMYSWVTFRVKDFCDAAAVVMQESAGPLRGTINVWYGLTLNFGIFIDAGFVGHAGICRTPMRPYPRRAPASSCCTVWWKSCLRAMQTAPQPTPTDCSWAGFWTSLSASSAS